MSCWPSDGDEARLLGQRDELVGGEQPAGRVLPPGQRLDAAPRARPHVEDRLVVQDELVAFDAAAQLRLEASPGEIARWRSPSSNRT